MFRKFLFIAAMIFSFAANAFTFPTHTQTIWLASASENRLQKTEMHLRWMQEPNTDWGYYAQYYFTFHAGAGGYTGLQKDSYSKEKKKAIFSIWNQSNAAKAHPAAGSCVYFDWEGNGASCIIEYQWLAGHEYKMVVKKSNEKTKTGHGVRWEGWVVNIYTDESTLIGKIDLDDSEGLPGFGDINPYNHALTHEFYTGDKNASCMDMPFFGIEWLGPFGNDGDITFPRSNVVYNTSVGTDTCPNVSSVSYKPYGYRQETGKEIIKYNKNYDTFSDEHRLHAYEKTECLFNWAIKSFPELFVKQSENNRPVSIFTPEGLYQRVYKSPNNSFNILTWNPAVDMLYFHDGMSKQWIYLGYARDYYEGAGCNR